MTQSLYLILKWETVSATGRDIGPGPGIWQQALAEAELIIVVAAQ